MATKRNATFGTIEEHTYSLMFFIGEDVPAELSFGTLEEAKEYVEAYPNKRYIG